MIDFDKGIIIYYFFKYLKFLKVKFIFIFVRLILCLTLFAMKHARF